MLDIRQPSATAEVAVRNEVVKACGDFDRGLITTGELTSRLNEIRKKEIVLETFLRHIDDLQRQRIVAEECHDLFYGENGELVEPELYKFLNKLQKKAVEIEQQPRDYSPLLDLVK